MNLYAWSGLLGAITGLTIPLLVFFNSSKENKTISSLWVSLNIGVALYGLGIIFATTTQNYDNALFWWRIAYLGIPLIAPFYFHHSYKLAGIKISKRLLSVVYGIGIFYWLLNKLAVWWLAFDRHYYCWFGCYYLAWALVWRQNNVANNKYQNQRPELAGRH